MFRRQLSTVALALALIIPAVVYAASDFDFRSCMQGVMNTRENRSVDVTNNYHDNWRRALEDKRGRLFDAWNIDNDRDRDNTLRAIDKDFRNILRDNDRNYKNEQRTIQNDFKNEERRCKDELKNRERDRKNVPIGKRCFNSDVCSPPTGICTTEFGDCRPACEPGSSPCIQVCAGSCVIR